MAHVRLESSSPADGASLDTAPDRVELTFSTKVAGTFQEVQLLTADGEDLAGDPSVTGSTVVVPVRGDASGTMLVTWRTLGPDGHPIKGEFEFSVGSAGASSSVAAEEYPRGILEATGSVARLAFYIALLIVAGGGFFASTVARRWRPRVFRRAGVVLIAASLVMYVTNLALAGEYSLAALVNPWNFVPHATTPVGRVALGCAAITAWLLLRGYDDLKRGDERSRRVFAAMCVALAVLPAFGGHAIASQLPWLRVPADMLHLLAASIWFGGIVQLQGVASASYATHPAVYPTVRLYARLAFASVLTLVITGTIAALLEIGLDVGELFGSTYGRLVLVKVALLGLTIPLAKTNQDRHVPALIDQSRRSSANLRRYVVFEIALVATIVAVTSWLVYETPPRHAEMGHDLHASAQ